MQRDKVVAWRSARTHIIADDESERRAGRGKKKEKKVYRKEMESVGDALSGVQVESPFSFSLFFFVRDLKYRVVGIAIRGRHRVFFVIIDLIEQWLGQPCRTLVVFGVTCFNAKILDVFLCESFPLFPLNFSLLSSLFSVFSLPSSFFLSSLFFHIFFLFLSLTLFSFLSFHF